MGKVLAFSAPSQPLSSLATGVVLDLVSGFRCEPAGKLGWPGCAGGNSFGKTGIHKDCVSCETLQTFVSSVEVVPRKGHWTENLSGWFVTPVSDWMCRNS